MVKKNTTISIDSDILALAKTKIGNMSQEFEKFLVMRMKSKTIEETAEKIEELSMSSIDKIIIDNIENKNKGYHSIIKKCDTIRSEFIKDYKNYPQTQGLKRAEELQLLLNDFTKNFSRTVEDMLLLDKIKELVTSIQDNNIPEIWNFIKHKYTYDKTFTHLAAKLGIKKEKIYNLLKATKDVKKGENAE